MDRRNFSTIDSVAYIWRTLGLPQDALKSLDLIEDGEFYSSSFKVSHLAHASIVLSALAASLLLSTKTGCPVPKTSIFKDHACAEFISERLYTLNGRRLTSTHEPIGGLHKTADGYVRMHDGFPHHRSNALKILGLQDGASREDVAAKMLEWKAVELESAGFNNGAVIVKLRSFSEWDTLPQAKAVADFPIIVRKIGHGLSSHPHPLNPNLRDGCLQGVRVVEMSRVIAAPVAGRTLAAHGADVIWVTSPTLPDQPELDIDTMRGKRTVRLDIKRPGDKAKLLELVRTADVFISSYRPDSLAAQGFSPQELATMNPDLIVATLNAWGEEGPWAMNRGFDSLVQAASGINIAEAERHGQGEYSRVLPAQALDHGSGYFLATGIMAALYKRTVDGGAYEVHVSLACVMKYLRSLGQLSPDRSFLRQEIANAEYMELNYTKDAIQRKAFERNGIAKLEGTDSYMEFRNTDFGELKALTHSARIHGAKVGFEAMPKPLGSDKPSWLDDE